MIKFLHAADLHLDSPLRMLERYEGAPVDELRLATRRALTNLVDVALREKVQFIVIAGDLYDGNWRDVNTGLFFNAQMARLADAAILVFVISGNHDAACKMTRSLRLPPNVFHFPSEAATTRTLDDLGVSLHGQSFAKPAVTADLSLAYPEPIRGMVNIGLLHTAAEGREGHERYAPCKVEGLRLKGYDYWALGHVHKREVLAPEPLIVFPGNTQGRNIRETGPKGCVIVSVQEGEAPAARFVPLAVARWESMLVKLSPDWTEEELLERVGKGLAEVEREVDGLPTVVRVRLTGEHSLADQWSARDDAWTGEVRSIATQQSGGSLWIEKLSWGVRMPRSDEHLDEGLEGLVLREIDELIDAEKELDALASPLKEVLRRLPADVRDALVAEGDPSSWAREHLEEVAALLVHRLGAQREEDA